VFEAGAWKIKLDIEVLFRRDETRLNREQETKMSDPMKIRATLVGAQGGSEDLDAHEMETGQRKDANGQLVPAHYIQDGDGDIQRQARPFRAMGAGSFTKSISVFPLQGWSEGREAATHLG